MILKNPYCKKLEERRIEMAVRAIEANYNPPDLPMGGFDPSPLALGLSDSDETAIFSKPRVTPPTQGKCSECGQPLCGDCA